MNSFLIGGEIVDDSAQKWAFEDVTPSQVRSFIGKLEDGAEVTFEISSPGGSVIGGTAICNIIKDACKKRGIKSKAHVIGIAASMASAIACACDEIEIDENAFMMIHNPWTVAQGDAEDLRKQADILDQIKNSIISVYRSKFSKTDEELAKLMDDETWFTGSEAEAFGFKATVLPTNEELKVAACAKRVRDFARIPEAAKALLAVGKQIEAVAEEQPQQEQPQQEQPQQEVVPETVTREECENRVKGMQSAMGKQLDALRRDHAAEIKNFTTQLDAVNEELIKAKAEITRLVARAEKAEAEAVELREHASAVESELQTKNTALATLNARVNAPAREPKSYQEKLATAKTPEERLEIAFAEAHNNR